MIPFSTKPEAIKQYEYMVKHADTEPARTAWSRIVQKLTAPTNPAIDLARKTTRRRTTKKTVKPAEVKKDAGRNPLSD